MERQEQQELIKFEKETSIRFEEFIREISRIDWNFIDYYEQVVNE